MATRKEIVDDIKRQFGSSFISIQQAAQYFSMSRNGVKRFLADVPVYESNKQKLYMALDIAKKLEMCER